MKLSQNECFIKTWVSSNNVFTELEDEEMQMTVRYAAWTRNIEKVELVCDVRRKWHLIGQQ